MFAQLISHHARIRPDAVAIVAPNRLLSFARFEAEISTMQGLLGEGAELEGLIAVALTDIVEHWTALFALARMGLATVSVLEADARALDRQLAEAGVR